MNTSLSVLKSGLRVITCEIPHIHSVTVMVGVSAGSRFENIKNNGISHFLEHMFFKGGDKYKTAKDVSRAIDSIGGVHNAFTGREYVGYYTKTAKEYLDISLDVLSDMLIHSTFPEGELEKEKGVVIEEINMYEDMPQEKVYQMYRENLYKGHPLGYDIAGSKENVMSFTRKDLFLCRDEFYNSKNTIICIVGNVSSSDVNKKVEKYFADIPNGNKSNYLPFIVPTSFEKKVFQQKDLEQYHVTLGAFAPSRISADYYSAYLLHIIFGGNSSSRLFQNLREEKGLCYYVHSNYSGLLDIGDMHVALGVDKKRVKEAIKLIKKEMQKLVQYGVKEEELSVAKSYAVGKLKLYLEDSENIADFLIRKMFTNNKLYTISELVESYESVELEQIENVSQKIFSKGEFVESVIGKKEF